MIVLYTWLITSIQDETRVGMTKYIFRIFTVTKNEVYLLCEDKFFSNFREQMLVPFQDVRGERGEGGVSSLD